MASFATPHNHHETQAQITMRDLRRHLINDHDSRNAHLTNDFTVLDRDHFLAHKGNAPVYEELPMNAEARF